MRRGVWIAVLVAACASTSESEDGTADSSTGIADTGTESATLTTSVSDTTPSTSGDPTTMSSMSMTGSETETETTPDTSETGPSGCVLSLECTDADAPICEDEECVACTAAADPDGACASKDASTPVCRDDGVCVQCTDGNPVACVDETPLCDGGSSSCIGCTYHEQCGSSACRIATGACFEETEVYDVGSGQTYPSITAAVTDLGEGVQVVLVLHAGASFDQGVTLSGVDTAYAFMSEDVPAPQWVQTSEMRATLRVENAAEAYVQNVRLTLNGFTGAAAVQADGGRVYLDRAAVVANQGGGVALSNGAFGQVRNCFVSGNGNEAVASRGLNVTDSTLDLSYSTVVRNDAGTDDSLVCNDGATVNVRNSVLVGRDSPSITCVPLDATFSVFDEAVAGQGNESVAMLDTGWFIDVFLNDFHLSGSGATQFADVAQWQSGDPAVDIDGDDPRPNVDGTADVAGADVP